MEVEKFRFKKIFAGNNRQINTMYELFVVRFFKRYWRRSIYFTKRRSNMQERRVEGRNRRFIASKIANCSSLQTMVGTRLRKLVVSRSASLLSEKVKHSSVVYDKQMKRYGEKDVMSSAWNAEVKEFD